MTARYAAVCFCLTLAACGQASPQPSPQAAARFRAQQQLLLAEMPLPDGVDPAAWTRLTSALGEYLAQPGRITLAAPVSSASAAQVTLDVGSRVLSWGYACQGDYDQNGEVNISDLKPLGVNLGEKSGGGPFPADSALAHVDGDGNGEINISDLQPLGVNLGRRVAEYGIYSSTSLTDYPAAPGGPNGPGAVLAGTLPFSAAAGDPKQASLEFSYTLPSLPAGTYFWVRPQEGAFLGTPSNALGSDGAPIPAGARYFPLDLGVSYTYEITELLGADWSKTDAHVYRTAANPQDGGGVWFELMNGGQDSTSGPVFSGMAFKGTCTDAFWSLVDDGGGGFLVLPETLAIGTTWNGSLFLGNPGDPFMTISTSQKLAAVEDVTIGAATYADCLRVDFTGSHNDGGPMTLSGSGSYWLAPNVGLVRITANAGPAKVATIELTDRQ